MVEEPHQTAHLQGSRDTGHFGSSDIRVEEGKWLIEVASSGLAACSDTCWEVATGLGMAKSGLSGFSSLIVNGVTWATDIGLLRVLSPEAGPVVSSTI